MVSAEESAVCRVEVRLKSRLWVFHLTRRWILAGASVINIVRKARCCEERAARTLELYRVRRLDREGGRTSTTALERTSRQSWKRSLRVRLVPTSSGEGLACPQGTARTASSKKLTCTQDALLPPHVCIHPAMGHRLVNGLCWRLAAAASHSSEPIWAGDAVKPDASGTVITEVSSLNPTVRRPNRFSESPLRRD